MAHWDVSAELRGPHGRWTRSAEALKRMSGEARVKLEGTTTEEKIANIPKGKTVRINGVAVHHISDTRVRVGFNREGKWEYQYYGSRAEAAKAVDAGKHHEEGTPAGPPAEKLPFTKVRERVLSLKEDQPETINGVKITLLQNGQYEVDLGGGKVARYDYPHQAAGAIRAGFHTSDAKPPRALTPPDVAIRETLGQPIPKVAHPKSLTITGAAARFSPADQKRMRQQVLKATTYQAEVTPDLVDKTDITVTQSPGRTTRVRSSALTLATHSGAHNLDVKPEVLIGGNADAVLKDNRGSWWVDTDPKHDLSMNVMTHEFGHGVHGLATRKGIISVSRHNPVTTYPAEQTFWRAFARAGNMKEPETFTDAYGRKAMDVGAWFARNKAGIKREVSQYGAKNLNEMMAELWTEYRLSPEPRPLAKYVGNHITRMLGGTG